MCFDVKISVDVAIGNMASYIGSQEKWKVRCVGFCRVSEL